MEWCGLKMDLFVWGYVWCKCFRCWIFEFICLLCEFVSNMYDLIFVGICFLDICGSICVLVMFFGSDGVFDLDVFVCLFDY